MQLLTTIAKEKSTYIITIGFQDEDGNAENPTSATWTLTDIDGTIINSREDVSISSPTSSEDVVLSGNDLAMQSGETGSVVRVFTVEAVYNSDLGSSLPLKASCKFIINDEKAIT